MCWREWRNDRLKGNTYQPKGRKRANNENKMKDIDYEIESGTRVENRRRVQSGNNVYGTAPGDLICYAQRDAHSDVE